ncbi:MAG: ketopantoate reductase family protein, partial [Anaerovoracaceae bacterium]
GAGAMGCLYGSKLSQIETNEVYLLDKAKPIIDQINAEGISLQEEGGTFSYRKVKGKLTAEEVGPVDLVIIFVKSMFTREAIRENPALFGDSTMVLTLQNGLGNIQEIEAALGSRENIIAGTTAHGATNLGPGKVLHAGKGKTVMGELTGELTPRLEQVKEGFNQAGIESTTSENVLGLIWDKLLVNVGINALTGITRCCNGKLLEHPELSSILEDAVREGMLVAEKKGIRLSFADPVAQTKAVCQATAKNTSSLLQDILHHRKTEIAMINGAIVKEGRLLNIDTPVNELLMKLILFFEQEEKSK